MPECPRCHGAGLIRTIFGTFKCPQCLYEEGQFNPPMPARKNNEKRSNSRANSHSGRSSASKVQKTRKPLQCVRGSGKKPTQEAHATIHTSSKDNLHPWPNQPTPKGCMGKSKRPDQRLIEHNYKFDLTNLVNEYGYDVIPALIKELGSQVRLKRKFAEDMLLDLGRPAKEDLIRGLKDRDPLVRQQSARILGRIGDKSADKPLTKLLQDSNVNVRQAAQEALDQLKS